MIEQLTDEEREWLRETESECRYDFPRKLVRIIDAQAAAIERVRAAMATLEDIVRVHGEDTTISAEALLDDLREALAAAPEHTAQALDVVPKGWRRTAAGGLCYDPEAAPEHTAPDDTSDTALIDGLSDSLAAANARVAELERAEAAAPRAQADRHERAVLSALEQAMKRSGDDPPYYECDFEMCGELARLNPGLPTAVNEYCAELARRSARE